jgi:hypothetical protein
MNAREITAPWKTAFVQPQRPRADPGEVLLQVQRLGYCGAACSPKDRNLSPPVMAWMW